MQKIELPLGRYYVYHHIHNGHVFYIGAGKRQRAFELTARNNKWKEYVKNIGSGSLVVKVVATFDSRDEALSFESKEISRLRPVTNIQGVPPKTDLKPCGFRLEQRHSEKLKALADLWGMSEAEALRKIIDEA